MKPFFNLSIIVTLLVVTTNCVFADAVTDKYLKSFQKYFSDYSMHYTMKCTYPNGAKISIVGVTAKKNENYYYDSSNYRFVLINPKWFLNADHQQKYISVAYLPSLQKKIGLNGMLQFSKPILSDDFFSRNAALHITKENGDTAWVALSIKEASNIESLTIKFLKSTNKPIQIDGVFNYPFSLNDDSNTDETNTYIKVFFSSNQMTSPASDQLFDDKRIIKEEGGKATLNRYNNYKTYRSKK